MWFAAEIILKSYLPSELEVGMLFTNRISVGVIDPYVELFELNEMPEDVDAFMAKHGAPVQMWIIDGNDDILATPEQIGWWDEGSHTDELRDITLSDINFLLRECEGCVEIEVEDYNDDDGYYYDAEDDELYFNNDYQEDDELIPILHDNKVVLRLELIEEDDEDWDELEN
jgi:hypothetical protein